MGFRGVVGAVATLAAAVGLAVPAEAAKTRVIRVNPFTTAGELAPGYRVTARRSGECPQASFRAVGTYRCFYGNGIAEPCWPDPNADEDEVVCLRSPYDRRGLRILLTEAPGEKPSSGRLDPWALTLTSGRRCSFIGGATGVVGRKRINYFCSRSVFLAGSPRKYASRRWTITGAKPPLDAFNFRRGKTASIRVAYYGARR